MSIKDATAACLAASSFAVIALIALSAEEQNEMIICPYPEDRVDPELLVSLTAVGAAATGYLFKGS